MDRTKLSPRSWTWTRRAHGGRHSAKAGPFTTFAECNFDKPVDSNTHAVYSKGYRPNLQRELENDG